MSILAACAHVGQTRSAIGLAALMDTIRGFRDRAQHDMVSLDDLEQLVERRHAWRTIERRMRILAVQERGAQAGAKRAVDIVIG